MPHVNTGFDETFASHGSDLEAVLLASQHSPKISRS